MGTTENLSYTESLSLLISHGEILKNRQEFQKAREIYSKAVERNPEDPFLIQRLALMTYKSKQPDPVSALHQALQILSGLNPLQSGDPETLGMSGSIHKKLFEITGEYSHLEQSLQFYKTGFHNSKNYYNGINLAYIYLVRSLIEENKHIAFSYFRNSLLTNNTVISICIELICRPGFEDRTDKEYVYETLAQAYLGIGQDHEVIKLIPTINEQSKGSFDLDIFHEQNFKLMDSLAKFKEKYPDFA
jgi:tetratricopeptide (TPR) repeat protein